MTTNSDASTTAVATAKTVTATETLSPAAATTYLPPERVFGALGRPQGRVPSIDIVSFYLNPALPPQSATRLQT